MHKKVCCTCRDVVLLIKPIAFLKFSLPSPSSLLKLPYISLQKRSLHCLLSRFFSTITSSKEPKRNVIWRVLSLSVFLSIFLNNLYHGTHRRDPLGHTLYSIISNGLTFNMNGKSPCSCSHFTLGNTLVDS